LKSINGFTTTSYFGDIKVEEIIEKRKGGILERKSQKKKRERKYIEINRIPRIKLKERL
jgi:hypothetical protein